MVFFDGHRTETSSMQVKQCKLNCTDQYKGQANLNKLEHKSSHVIKAVSDSCDYYILRVLISIIIISISTLRTGNVQIFPVIF